MSRPPLLGITGPEGSGKDTFATMLVESLGGDASIYRLAAPLKRAVALAVGARAGVFEDRSLKDSYHPYFTGDGPARTPRQALIDVGMYLRSTVGADVWLQAADNTIDGPTIVPDIRFINEVEWVRARGGMMVYIERPNVRDPQRVYDVSTLRKHCTMVVMNDHLSDLKDRADAVAVRWKLEVANREETKSYGRLVGNVCLNHLFEPL